MEACLSWGCLKGVAASYADPVLHEGVAGAAATGSKEPRTLLGDSKVTIPNAS